MTDHQADLIVTVRDVVHGQARIRDTRIPVSVVLDGLAASPDEDGILRHGNGLRHRGQDVHTVVQEQLAGRSDPVVVAAATDEGRMLLTLDRVIGDLRRYRPVATPGSSSDQLLRTRAASSP